MYPATVDTLLAMIHLCLCYERHYIDKNYNRKAITRLGRRPSYNIIICFFRYKMRDVRNNEMSNLCYLQYLWVIPCQINQLFAKFASHPSDFD